MPLYKAWDVLRRKRKSVIADSFDEFVVKVGNENWSPSTPQEESNTPGRPSSSIEVKTIQTSDTITVAHTAKVESTQRSLVFSGGNLTTGPPVVVETSAEESGDSETKCDLEKHSKTFGKDVDRPLSEYEKHINAASLQLCQENASLLGNRKKLLDLAKQEIDADGYTYKEKTSRSKVFGNSAQKFASEFQQANIAKEMRQRKINELHEDIQVCKESISLLEKQRSKFATAEKFIQAADVVEQIKTHRKKMRELELELAKHEKAESRSKKYHKRNRRSWHQESVSHSSS
ncbi:uncharacterized protein [Montipora capricornis]|uniref:uncharacterized protein n=1 Tax=Montipora capricornis TaxID=246305 RepID=UPI0035F14187